MPTNNYLDERCFAVYERLVLRCIRRLKKSTIAGQRVSMGRYFKPQYHAEALRRLTSNGHITEGNEVCLTRYIFVTTDDPEKKVRSFNSEHAGVEFKPGDMAKMTRHKYAGAVVRVNV